MGDSESQIGQKVAQLEVNFRPLALDDIAEVAAFYARQDDDRLVRRFLSAIDQATERISAFPLSCPKYHRNSRRLMLRAFPFCVCYRVVDDTVQVLAVLHAKRDLGILRRRVE